MDMTPIGFTVAVKGLSGITRQKNVQMGISYDSFISLVNRSKPKQDSSVLQVSSRGSWLSAQRIVSFDSTVATMTRVDIQDSVDTREPRQIFVSSAGFITRKLVIGTENSFL